MKPDLRNTLSQYGIVNQCEELDGKFHVKISDGFKANNTLQVLKEVIDGTENKYPIVEKARTDNGIFHLILKQ